MATIAAETKTFKVGIICGSARKPRVGDQITTFVHETIEAAQQAKAAAASAEPNNNSQNNPVITFDYIDVAALDLPFFDEPVIPARVTSAEGYAHEHTRAWSRRVAALDAFVFVSPQYNWGVPASLKNALDYLFNEWRAKPAAVVTYGGHGGDKCAAALATVLGGGLDMRMVPRGPVCLAFPDRGFLVKAARGEALGLDGRTGAEAAAGQQHGPWAEKKGEIVEMWEELVGLMVA
jgi:NAD(P)H-dependent FMN reductase